MSIKKTLKRTVSNLVPKGYTKEKLKATWYNLSSQKDISFSVEKHGNRDWVYLTRYKGLKFRTHKPLYPIIADFSNYQHYYNVKKGDTVIDAGANVGYLTLLFLNLTGKNGRVLAFEPDDKNIHKLESNLSLNQLDGNLNIHRELLWSENTEIDFQESGTVASSALWFDGLDNIVKKPALALDDWCKTQNLRSLDFIKMDIEGAELEALKGCKELIELYQPNFAIASYHIVNNQPTYLEIEAFFKSINYPYITKGFGGYEIITFAGPSLNTPT